MSKATRRSSTSIDCAHKGIKCPANNGFNKLFANRKAVFVAAAMATALASQAIRAANTEYDVANGTDLTDPATYSVGGSGTIVGPTVTSDVTFNGGFTSAFTLNSNQTFGSLNDLIPTAISVANAGSLATTLTLGGAGNLGNSVSGTPSDLLYVAGGSSLTLTGGSGSTAMGIVLGQSGNFNVVGTATISSAISDANLGLGINMTGGGTLVLTGSNSYTGGTAVTAGTLQLGDGTVNGTFGSGTYSIASGATLRLNALNMTGTAGTPAGVVWGNITGAGTLDLAVTNESDWAGAASGQNYVNLPSGFTGTLLIESGRVPSNGTGSLGNATAVVVDSGGQLGMWQGGTFPQNFTIAGTGWGESGYESALRLGSSTITGTLTLSANATIASEGNATLSGQVYNAYNLSIGSSSQGGTVTFSAANAYTGGTTVNYGTLAAGIASVPGVSGTFGLNSAVTVNGGNLNITGFDTQIGSLTGSGGGVILGSATLTIGGDDTSPAAYAGVISGNGSVTKVGTGTLTLSGGNSFSGGLTINSGIVSTNNLNAAGSAQGVGESTLNLNGGTFQATSGPGANWSSNVNIQAGGGTLDTTNGYVFFSGAMSGSGPLAFIDSVSTGTGNTAWQWLVTGDSPSFTGPITIGTSLSNSGNVQYRSNAASPFGSGTITINAGGLLSADNGSTVPSTLSNNFILNGGLLATQTPNMTYSGAITLGSGTNSTIGNYGGNGTVTLSGPISGSGGIAINSASSVTLSGSNSYTGATTITAGTLILGNANAVQDSAVAVNGNLTFAGGIGTFTIGGLSGGGTLTLTDTASNPVTVNLTIGSVSSFTGNIVGAGGVNISGTGTLALNNNNSFAGNLTINSGTVSSNNLNSAGSAQGMGQGTLVLNGGTFQATSGPGASWGSNITVGTNGGTLDTTNGYVFYSGSISGSGQLNFIDSSTANTSNNAWQWLDTGNSPSFTGPVTIGTSQSNSGNVQYRSNAASPLGSGTITINAGGLLSADNGSTAPSTLGNNFILNGGLLATQTPNMTYTGAISLGTGTNSTVGDYSGGGGTVTLSGPISGSGGLTVISASSVTYNASTANSYSGTTYVNNGSLFLGDTGGVAISGPVVIGAGDTNQPKVLALAANQFAPGVTITFNNAVNNWTWLALGGFNQTLDGIVSGTTSIQGSGVIENSGAGVTAAGPATLTLAGSGNYDYNGYLRDTDGGINNSLALGLTLSGTGTQTLVGQQIAYSGATAVNSGTLVLQDTTNFASTITVGNSGTLNLVRTATGFANRSAIAGGNLTSSGTINVNNTANTSGNTDGGWVIINGTSNLTGTINVNSGVFATDDGGSITGSATVNVAAGAVFSNHSSNGVTIGGLDGAGDVSPAQGFSGTQYNLTVGAGDQNGSFSGIIHGNNTDATDGDMEAGYLSLSKTGAGTQVLLGSNTYTGATTVNGGILQIDGTGSLASGNYSGNIALNAGTLLYTSTTNQTFSGNISGGGNLTWTTPATLTLTNGGNSFSGNLTINSGLVTTNTFGSVNAAQLILDGGTFQYTGGAGQTWSPNITVATNGGTIDTTNGYVFFGGSFSGSGPLTFLDSAASTYFNAYQWLVTGNSPSFTGPVSIGSGSGTTGNVQYRSNAASPFGSGTITINAGGLLSADNGSTVPSTLANNFVLNGGFLGTQTPNMTYTGNVTLASGSNSTVGWYSNGNGTVTLSGPVSGSGALTINTNSSVTLTNSNSYSGGTTVATGTLLVGNNNALGSPTGAPVTVTGGNLDLGGFSPTIDGLSDGGSTSGTVRSSSGSPTLNITTNGQTFGGTITSGISVNINGTTAAQTFTGNNNYSGGTTIAGGTLLVNNTTGSGTGSGTVTVTGGRLGGTGTIGNGSNLVSINSGGTISPGPDAANATVGTLTTGNQTWNNGGTYIFKTTVPTGDGINMATNIETASAVINSVDQDFLNINGALDIEASTTPFILDITHAISTPVGKGIYIVANASAVEFNGSPATPASNGILTSDFTVEDNGIAETNAYTVTVVADSVGGYDVQVNVPEPGSLGLLGIGALGLLRRRRTSRQS